MSPHLSGQALSGYIVLGMYFQSGFTGTLKHHTGRDVEYTNELVLMGRDKQRHCWMRDDAVDLRLRSAIYSPTVNSEAATEEETTDQRRRR